MTVTLDLTPELEKHIVAQVMAEGPSVEAYLLSVIETATAPPASERASLEEFKRRWTGWPRGSMRSL